MQRKRSYCHVHGPKIEPDVLEHRAWSEQTPPEYLVYAEKRSIDMTPHILLFFYDKEGSIRYIIFQTSDAYNTLVCTGSNRRWSDSKICSLIKNCKECSRSYSEESDQIMKVFCENGKSGLEAVFCLQDRIYYENNLPTANVLFKDEPMLPDDWDEFIFDHLPHYIFYDALQKGRTIKGYCTKCCSEVAIGRHKYNEEGVCPACGAKIRYRSDGRRGDIVDRLTMQIICKIGEDMLLLRFFKVYSAYAKGSRILNTYVYEPARKLIYFNDSYFNWQGYIRTYENGSLSRWRQGYFPRVHYQISFNGDEEGFLYRDNLNEVLKGTKLEHCALDLYKIDQEVCVIDYLYSYIKAPVLEQLLKSGFSRLAGDVVKEILWQRGTLRNFSINLNGANMKEILGVDREICRLLKQKDASLSMVGKIKELCFHKIIITEELYSYIVNHNITDMSGLAEVLSFITLNKLKFYLDQQRTIGNLADTGYEQVYTMYKDYLHAASELGYDMKNSFVLFPRHLKKAHDEATSLFAKKVDEEECQLIIDRNRVYQERYGYDNGLYIMRAPVDKEEMIKEGQNLHNCVAGYSKDVAEGKTAVLLIRDKKAPERSLCCIEVKNGKMVQAEMKGHAKPTEEVQEFLDEWKREKLNECLRAA